MTTLVTGAAGFIGYHTARALLEKGEQVIGVDDLNDYYPPQLKKARLEQLARHGEFEFHQIDIADWDGLRAALAGKPIRRAIHLAGRKGFEVDSIGEKMIEQLFDAELMRDAADLFHLDPAPLVELDRWGEKTVENLMAQLEERRHVPFARFLAALSVPGLGEATGRLLARTFDSLDALMAADEEALQHVDGIGPKRRKEIKESWEKQKSVRRIMVFLHRHHVLEQ